MTKLERRFINSALLGFILLSSHSAFAQYNASGNVDLIVNSGADPGPGCSYASPSGTSCAVSVSSPSGGNGLVLDYATSGSSSATVQNGLTANGAASADVNPNVGSFDPGVVRSAASASIADSFSFGPSAPTTGFAVVTLSANEAATLGATVPALNANVYIYDSIGHGQAASNCELVSAGTCTTTYALSYGDGLSLLYNLSTSAQAVVGGGFGYSDASSILSSAAITEVTFENSSGQAISLAYTTSSGFQYPVSPVPLPPSQNLLALGLATLGIFAFSRTRRR